MRTLRGRGSGLRQLTYILDIPDGYGRLPIGPGNLFGKPGQPVRVEDQEGARNLCPGADQPV